MSQSRLGQVAFPAAVVSVVAMMVIPLPTAVLDLLLTLNLAAAVLILLASMSVARPLELAAFPSLLLIATLFRLGLNVSSTRLILSRGEAGQVIDAFGSFVIAGSVIVGLVVFLILVVIQFVVITNGSTRVAEVSARFTLDAMPGKQMAIDADLNAGAIDEAEARTRRESIAAEADFYGAMDGASKFVKGDAIASIVITLINLIGGLMVGAVQMGMPVGDAVDTYSTLTVGDGLVSQIPALLISIAAGIIITRADGNADLGSDVVAQFARQNRALRMGGLGVMALAMVPGLPVVPFVAVGSSAWLVGRRLGAEPPIEDEPPAESPDLMRPDDPAELARAIRVEPIGLELAVDMIDLVDVESGGDLLDRVRALRRKLAQELGLIIPPVRTRDNLDLPRGSYAIYVHGVEVARGDAPPGSLLVIADDLDRYPGPEVREAVFGLSAKWIPVGIGHQVEMDGATVVDRSSVITTHLAEIARRNAGVLLSRQDTKALLDLVRETDPVAVDELTTSQVSLSEIHRVLQDLLEEGVPIRDLTRILEAIGERARTNRDPESLVEAARGALGPALSSSHAVDGTLAVVTFEPNLEQSLHGCVRQGERGSYLAIDPEEAQRIVEGVGRCVLDAQARGADPVLVCGSAVRLPVRRLLDPALPAAPAVLSFSELGAHLRIETYGTVTSASSAEV